MVLAIDDRLLAPLSGGRVLLLFLLVLFLPSTTRLVGDTDETA